jgi:Phosphotransferase enzyme family
VPDEVSLGGGVANAGAVTRVGDAVHRPSTPATDSAHRFLRALRSRGFLGVPEPLERGADGRERLTFVHGDVAVPPYPQWAQTDAVLASVAALMLEFHEAADGIPIDGRWNADLADPQGGDVICHNDVCLENVVFRDGTAVAVLDWEFAAPGRPVYDVAQMARRCVPVTDDLSATRLGWVNPDKPARLRLVSDQYGLDRAGRATLVSALDDAIQLHGRFVQRRVEAGDENFIKMWNDVGGVEWHDRRRHWWSDAREAFERALS